jgi:DNA-binding transcriptional MerR regulator
MFIGDLAASTGLSVDTLRYYEKIGLIARPLRDSGGRRVYDAGALRWVEFLKRLKATGMGIADMLTYARLRAEGDRTSASRREMLVERRALVRAQLQDLTECLDILDGKIETYRAIEADLAADRQPKEQSDDRPNIGPSAAPKSNRHGSTVRQKPVRSWLETT